MRTILELIKDMQKTAQYIEYALCHDCPHEKKLHIVNESLDKISKTTERIKRHTEIELQFLESRNNLFELGEENG